MERLLLVVDGGNSKTDAILLTTDGVVLERRSLRGSGGGPLDVAEVLREGFSLDPDGFPLDALGSDPLSAVVGCVAALAGLDFPEDAERFGDALRSLMPLAWIDVSNDVRGILDTLGPDTHGLAVVSGAGMNAIARGPAGVATVPALDWSSGDRGGAMHVGREAVRLAYRSWDGRGARTTLETAVPRALGVDGFPELARNIRDGLISDAAIGRLSAVVAAEAAAGDDVARGVLDAAADEVVAVAIEVAGRAWAGRVRDPAVATPAVLAGGMFADPAFRGRVEHALRAHGFRPEMLDRSPVDALAVRALALAADGSEEPGQHAREGSHR
jgi:N-acetylglucosamine kinase-like BadF-type ATPase